MAGRQDPAGAHMGRQPPAQQVKKPECVSKEQPRARRSTRLTSGLSRQNSENATPEREHITVVTEESLNRAGVDPLKISNVPSNLHLKRKRRQEAGCSPVSKSTAEGDLEPENNSSEAKVCSIRSWVQTKRWPSALFEPDRRTAGELLEHDSWLEERMAQPPPPTVQYVEINNIRYPRPIRKVPSLRRKQSDASSTESGTQETRERKSTPYKDTRYKTLLAAKGSYMDEFDDDNIPIKVRDLCQKLLNESQAIPQDSLFRDDLFKRFCRKIGDRNEAILIQDLTRLLVPSAQNLAIYGDKHLDVLIENVNEGWVCSIPMEGPRPQPDYSVGFKSSAFTSEQSLKLGPLIGSVFDTSFFAATYRMYFPFLTCEVKCGNAALDVADRQNSHSMTLAVRGVVELFRLVGRERELHQDILAFSISHNHRTVRLYGHYPVIDGRDTTYYRHPINTFDFTALEGKEKWTTFKFTKNIYDLWMPHHLKRICSAIDQLPSGLDFEVQGTEVSGLSQALGSLLSEPVDAESSQDQTDSASIVPLMVTPEISVAQDDEHLPLKKPKRKHAK